MSIDIDTSLQADLVNLRHSIHEDPEIGLDLPRTQQKILDYLQDLPVTVTTGSGLSSVVAVLRGAKPGPTVLLRGDMDALPVTEQTGLDYSSKVDGAMHACGHDTHVTMLAGAATILSGKRDELAGSVIFMFQPGEEGYDGAGLMVDEGVLDAAGSHPIAAYALHVTTMVPKGVFATRPGAMLAAADSLHVTVNGAGGHGSAPQSAYDPIPATCEIVLGLQSMVTRRFNTFDPVVLTVGSLHSGTTNNVIPGSAHFDATIRTFSVEARAKMQVETERVVSNIAAAHGLTADIEYRDGYPATITDESETAFAEQVVVDMFGADRFELMKYPLSGSEDFSRILSRVPGSFLMLGAGPSDVAPADAPYNHSPLVIFEDDVLSDGANLLAELAVRRLGSH